MRIDGDKIIYNTHIKEEHRYERNSKTTLLAQATARLDLAAGCVEADDKVGAKEAISEAKKMIEDVYDEQMSEDDK